MSKRPTRTWAMVASLGIPLSVVGVSAMAVSYATLIDVARVNGLPLPELFPVLVDVGTVACMIAAAQFRMRGMPGRWLAYLTFVALSAVSIVANASHAWRTADLTITNVWAATLLAATPPAALLAITHLVMMLIPDEKERAKLLAQRERQDALTSKRNPTTPTTVTSSGQSSSRVVQHAAVAGGAQQLRLIEPSSSIEKDAVKAEAGRRAVEYFRTEGRRPTGALVGEWLGGRTPKTGQRLMAALEAEGRFDEPADADADAMLA